MTTMADKSSEAEARDAKTTADFIKRTRSGETKPQATADEPSLDEYLPFQRELCEPAGVIGDFSRYATSTAMVERPQLSLAMGIALFGALFGKWYRSEERNGNKTNFYVMTVLATSGGKQHVQDLCKNLLRKAGDDALEIVEAEVTCDTAIHEALKEGWGVKLFLVDECGEFLKGASAGNKNASAAQASILECFKSLYSCSNSTYASKRKVGNPRVFISEPQACFFGATTQRRFAAGLSPDEIEGGWAGRCLIFTDDKLIRAVMKPQQPYPPQVLDVIRRFAPVKGKPAPEATVVHFTPEAKEVYRRFDDKIWAIREQLDRERNPYAPVFGKTVENAKKLGLLYACSESAYEDGGSPSIGSDAAAWACKVAYACSHNLFVFAKENGGGSPFAELKSKVYREIKATGTKGCTPRELTRAIFDMRSDDRDNVLESLTDGGLVLETETERSGKPGRPKGARYVATCWLK